jgi:choline dehydrogenase-like flavoprotein
MNGLTHSVNSIYNGQRSGAYLFVKDKPNITVVPEVRSKRLLIGYADRKCTGVTVIDGSGTERNFYARREVILAQGVFESPKLLMLSGIGPGRELAKHGIDVIVDSRHVGQHLLDHPGVPFVLRIKDGFGMDETLLREGPKHDAAVAAYKKDHSGPVGSGLLEMIGFSPHRRVPGEGPHLPRGQSRQRRGRSVLARGSTPLRARFRPDVRQCVPVALPDACGGRPPDGDG